MRSCRNSVLFNKRLSISQKNHNFNELTSTHRISIAPNKTLYMNPENPLHALVAISIMPKLNSCLYYPLIQKCGGIEGYFLEQEKSLNIIYQELNIPPHLFDRQKALQEAQKELDSIDKHNIQICSIEDSQYPSLLRQCEDYPLVFYYKGPSLLQTDRKLLAIVGTRHASSRYQKKVETIIEELSHIDPRIIIVSGLAYGIDASAHRACLKHGLATFAVLGHGLHMIYPASHKKMADHILQSEGMLISEFPCSAKIFPTNFLRRNRIIAGLCHATLIAESAQKGGAMATARFAFSYNREVMALPGRFDDSYSAGCNQLIKENTAALVENSEDIAHLLGIKFTQKHPQPLQLNLFETTSSDQANTIITLLQKHKESTIDDLIHLSNIPQRELLPLLLQLELEKKVFSLPGNRYTLNITN